MSVSCETRSKSFAGIQLSRKCVDPVTRITEFSPQNGNDRLLKLAGTPFEVGKQLGEHLGHTLAENIHHYLKNGPLKFGNLRTDLLQKGAMRWLDSLPQRFQEEMRGLSEGSGVSLQQIAEWGYADADIQTGCSAFLLSTDQGCWVGRNNDLWTPELWGFVIQCAVKGRLGTLTFGMQAEIFAATGLNQTGLWLHYNWLPTFDSPGLNSWTPYVLLTEMLETCKTIDEVELVLNSTTRTGGMLIFAVHHDGNGPEGAMFECTCQRVSRQNLGERFIAGTNHYQTIATPQAAESYAPDSVRRLDAIESQIRILSEQPSTSELVAILADPRVEQHLDDYGTVYANLYNHQQKAIWFTFGGYPAASHGRWRQIHWPFT